MIPLDFTQFCFGTVAVLLAIVGLIWLSYIMVRRVRERRAERNNIRCAVCGCIYPASAAPRLPEACPRCGTLNEFNKNLTIY